MGLSRSFALPVGRGSRRAVTSPVFHPWPQIQRKSYSQRLHLKVRHRRFLSIPKPNCVEMLQQIGAVLADSCAGDCAPPWFNTDATPLLRWLIFLKMQARQSIDREPLRV